MGCQLQRVTSPGFGGGRLKLFNRLFVDFAEFRAGRLSQRPFLVLDENLFGADDLRFPVQNAHGDVVFLEVPDHGKLGHGSRIAFRNALCDTMPPTAELEQAIDFLLPPPLQSPLEAAKELWQRLFPDLEIEVIRRGAPSAGASWPLSGITWASARHFQTMRELRLSEELVLAGEEACLKSLVPVPAGELGEKLQELRQGAEEALQQLKPLAADVDPSLVGAWVRLRRNLRQELDDFAERADRCGRNRSGIRRARLHALAQALRPHGQAQETHLSLCTAMASFQLDVRQPSSLLTSFLCCEGGQKLLHTQ